MKDSIEDRQPRETKVERLLDEYELEGMDAELRQSWTGQGGQRSSLRQLANFFNKRILESVLDESGLETFDGDVANIYRLLTAEDVSAGQRTETESKLENANIDVDDLRSDFVSHQAVYTYLTEREGVSFEEKTTEERIHSANETIQKLCGRTESVTVDTLNRLITNDDIALDTFSTFVSVQIFCEQCGSQTDAKSLLTNDGCDCLKPNY